MSRFALLSILIYSCGCRTAFDKGKSYDCKASSFRIIQSELLFFLVDSQQILASNFLEIDKSALDSDGFPKQVAVSFSHKGKNVKRQLRKDATWNGPNVYTISNGIVSRSDDKVRVQKLSGFWMRNVISVCSRSQTFFLTTTMIRIAELRPWQKTKTAVSYW
jgi:hypothetical protein